MYPDAGFLLWAPCHSVLCGGPQLAPRPLPLRAVLLEAVVELLDLHMGVLQWVGPFKGPAAPPHARGGPTADQETHTDTRQRGGRWFTGKRHSHLPSGDNFLSE